LLTGVIQAAVIHYLIAKVFGPLLFGRLWCGWACWTLMILDLLPFQEGRGRLPGRWGWLRYGHFALSFGIVALVWYGFSYGGGAAGSSAVYWFLAGNALYYLSGITLAYVLKDNRIPDYTRNGQRVLSTECTLCQTCLSVCPQDALKLSFGFDLGGKELLRDMDS